MVQPLSESVQQFLTKLNTQVCEDPTIPLVGTYAREANTTRSDETCTGVSIVPVVTMVPNGRQPNVFLWTHAHSGKTTRQSGGRVLIHPLRRQVPNAQ